MESLYLLISAFFILLLSSFMFYKNRPNFTVPNLPPGSFGWPVLGESYEFLSMGWKGYPEKFIFDRIRKFSSNIFKTSLFMEPVAVFAGAECHKFLFSNENKLVVVWWPESVKKLFPTAGRNTYTEEGLKVRKLVITQFLKQEGLQKYIGIMDSIAQRHFSMGWEKEETVFVSQLTKMYTFWLACRFFLSIEDPVRVAKLEAPFKLVTRGIMSIPINFPGTSFSKAIKASNFIREELIAIIKLRKVDLAENRVSSNQDLLSHVLLATDETGKHMTEMYIADHILGLLVAGHDTVSVTCTFIVKYLAELPDVYDKVYKEQMEIARSKSGGELLKWNDIQKMKYSWNVACEVMRLAPPLQGTFREAITDFVYKGFSIPKGLKLYWSAHSTHRNPECFPEPEKFDPTRFEGKGPAPYTYVPFGGGPRMCPGTEYARVVILVFMHNLVRRFKFEKVIADEKIIVDPTPAPAKGLPVRLFRHQHNACCV